MPDKRSFRLCVCRYDGGADRGGAGVYGAYPWGDWNQYIIALIPDCLRQSLEAEQRWRIIPMQTG